MEREATIIGTHEGYYLACIDEEAGEFDCDNECPGCSFPCRALLQKEQRIEKGRRVLAEIDIPLISQPPKLIAVIVTIYIVVFLFMLIMKKTFLTHYRGYLMVILSAFFAAAAFYLILKLREEKKKDSLRKGKILRVFPPDRQ